MKSLPALLSISCAALACLILGQARASGAAHSASTSERPAAAGAHAAGTSTGVTASADPRVFIASKVPGAKPEDVHATPIPGLYEIMRGTDAAYVTADGKYAIAGDLYDLRTNVNLTDNERRQTRLKLLAQIPESQMVIFGAKSEPHTITVFTDVDCPYCRKLHSQIAEYNRLGIRVRYMFYPRTGPNTPSWTRAEEVWCSSDRHTALTQAKLGEELHVKLCPNTPVAREYELGEALDVQGTPSIVLANGDMLPGYVSPSELAHLLRTVAH
ncbi:MAG: DsbC family protein [Steroidobacteraceae bacterium]